MASQETEAEVPAPSTPTDGRAVMYSKAREAGVVAGLYIGSVAVALIMSAALVAVTGGSWREVFSALLDGSLRAPGRWGDTLGVAVPLIFVGVGTVIGGRAGLINIGQEGQLTFGAAVAMTSNALLRNYVIDQFSDADGLRLLAGFKVDDAAMFQVNLLVLVIAVGVAVVGANLAVAMHLND